MYDVEQVQRALIDILSVVGNRCVYWTPMDEQVVHPVTKLEQTLMDRFTNFIIDTCCRTDDQPCRATVPLEPVGIVEGVIVEVCKCNIVSA